MNRARVMIFGTFDLLHPGHEFLIGEGMKMGDVIVIVARDVNVQRIKGRPPAENEKERMNAMQKKFPEVLVVLGNPKDFLAPLKKYKPDILLLGYDQRMPPGVTEESLGIRIKRADAHEPHRFKSSLMKKNAKHDL
jgi:FAD synthetase